MSSNSGLFPSRDKFSQFDSLGGCEDPRIVQTKKGKYVLLYTSWNYEIPRLSVAFSDNLLIEFLKDDSEILIQREGQRLLRDANEQVILSHKKIISYGEKNIVFNRFCLKIQFDLEEINFSKYEFIY